MKLKVYNTTSLPPQRITTPFIHLNVKTGVIRFNENICKQLELKAGTQVQLLQDQSDETIWYLELVKKDGFLLSDIKSRTSPGIFFCSCPLIRHVFDSVAFTERSGRLLIGEAVKMDKRTLHTLITGSLRNK